MTHNAKRYQFLRDRFALESNNDEADFAKLAHLNGDEFDAALDAAMLKAGFEVAQEVEPVAWRFIDDEDGGHISYSGNEPTQAQKDYLAKWNRPAWTPLFTAPQAVNAELLEALKYALVNLDGIEEGTDFPSYVIREKARAAIQKAEGAKP